jgi:hypothetical protein
MLKVMKILVNPLDRAAQLSQEPGNWVVAVVETRVSWPLKKQAVRFEDKEFLLLPVEEREKPSGPTLPGIAVRTGPHGSPAGTARTDIFRFASALSWAEGMKIEVVGWGGGGLPRSLGIIRSGSRTAYLNTTT